MKKNYKYLLVAMLLITSCSNKVDDSSSSTSTSESTVIESSTTIESSSSSKEESSIVESSTIEESSSVEDTSFIDANYEDSRDVLLIKDIFEYEDDVDRSLKVNNVFANATYSYSTPVNSTYNDDNFTKLTDGITTDLFDTTNWVSWQGRDDESILFDVSDTFPRVGQINVHMLSQQSYGIYYPKSVKLEASYDGNTFINLGEIYTPSDIEASSDYTYTFSFDRFCSASFYKITFLRGYIDFKQFLFFDEITAYDYSENGTIDLNNTDTSIKDFYNYSLNSTITTPVNKTDSDYNEHQNLALLDGVDVDISHFSSMSEKEALENTTIDKANILHDGITTTKLTGDEFFRFAYGKGRDVVFDLGNTMAVDSISMDVLSKFTSSIQVFNAYSVSLSNDGTNFVSVGGEYTKMLTNRTNKVYTLDLEFKDCYKARYVKISFVNATNLDDLAKKVWISEIKIMGYKNCEGKEEATYDETIDNGNYPSITKNGVNNIAFYPIRKDYYCHDDNMLPILAHLDQDGNVDDYYFDSVAFCLNFWEFLNSGDAKQDVTLAGAAYLNNLKALDETMGKINDTLKGNKKIKVFLAINELDFDATCNDVDNDGKKEDLNTEKDLEDFLLYEVKYLIGQYNSQVYENLELAGFYYSKEYLHENKTDFTMPAFKAMNDYLHENNYISCWCPFYGVDTISYWKDFGFDFACYQPNYMFNVVPEARLDATAKEALLNGMCVEIEIEDCNSKASIAKYYSYLEKGIEYGYMNSIKMYYIGAIPGSLAKAYETNYELYETTYKYAMGTLDKDFNKANSVDLNDVNDITVEVKNNESVSYTLSILTKVDYEITTSPLFGSIQINNDGTITYNSLYGYQGYDSITLLLDDYTGNSKEITITFKVTK